MIAMPAQMEMICWLLRQSSSPLAPGVLALAEACGSVSSFSGTASPQGPRNQGPWLDDYSCRVFLLLCLINFCSASKALGKYLLPSETFSAPTMLLASNVICLSPDHTVNIPSPQHLSSCDGKVCNFLDGGAVISQQCLQN